MHRRPRLRNHDDYDDDHIHVHDDGLYAELLWERVRRRRLRRFVRHVPGAGDVRQCRISKPLRGPGDLHMHNARRGDM